MSNSTSAVDKTSCMQPIYNFHNRGAARFGDNCVSKLITINPDDNVVVKIVKLVTTIILTTIANLFGSIFDLFKGNSTQATITATQGTGQSTTTKTANEVGKTTLSGSDKNPRSEKTENENPLTMTAQENQTASTQQTSPKSPNKTVRDPSQDTTENAQTSSTTPEATENSTTMAKNIPPSIKEIALETVADLEETVNNEKEEIEENSEVEENSQLQQILKPKENLIKNPKQTTPQQKKPQTDNPSTKKTSNLKPQTKKLK